MGRRAFTLIELLVIIAIIGIMTTTAVLSVVSGQRAVRVKGATRDVFAAIRQARSTALVTQQPAIITYSNDTEDGEPVAKIEITSAKLFDSTVDRSRVQTLTGAPLSSKSLRETQRESGRQSGGDGFATSDKDKEGGRTIEEILFAPVENPASKAVSNARWSTKLNTKGKSKL
ncbi:MAG: prepilin-type N-terminal cleavage/methylation domain-containing protein [Kiritimatiellae bacterium]|nr:prepilin-type N-terminal cleavage/methylation domain-containing protein [Kiritimatiellia bacterium]